MGDIERQGAIKACDDAISIAKDSIETLKNENKKPSPDPNVIKKEAKKIGDALDDCRVFQEGLARGQYDD